jgi:hypothetical protein
LLGVGRRFLGFVEPLFQVLDFLLVLLMSLAVLLDGLLVLLMSLFQLVEAFINGVFESFEVFLVDGRGAQWRDQAQTAREGH